MSGSLAFPQPCYGLVQSRPENLLIPQRLRPSLGLWIGLEETIGVVVSPQCSCTSFALDEGVAFLPANRRITGIQYCYPVAGENDSIWLRQAETQ